MLHRMKCPNCKKESEVIEGGEVDPKDLKEWPYFICQKCEYTWHGKKKREALI